MAGGETKVVVKASRQEKATKIEKDEDQRKTTAQEGDSKGREKAGKPAGKAAEQQMRSQVQKKEVKKGKALGHDKAGHIAPQEGTRQVKETERYQPAGQRQTAPQSKTGAKLEVGWKITSEQEKVAGHGPSQGEGKAGRPEKIPKKASEQDQPAGERKTAEQGKTGVKLAKAGRKKASGLEKEAASQVVGKAARQENGQKKASGHAG